jgi:hypothetical protein
MKQQIVTLLHSWIPAFAGMTLFVLPMTIHAQTIPISTQKQVISTFKADLNQYFPFPSSTCSEKPRGDANCDNRVDLFDLSIWQVEDNNPKGIKRADFNGDGVVSLVDFGIWKNTYFPSPSVIPAKVFDREAQTESAGIQGYFAWILDRVQDDILNGITLHAQQQSTDTQNIRRSLPVTYSDGSSQVFNQNPDGTTNQITFDNNSNPVSSLIFNSEGTSQAQSSFVSNGDEVVATTQNGINVQTVRKADGPVIQSFKDQNSNILAIKSWPNLASLENNDPPLAVTVPTKDNNLMTLNISPNGTGIIIQTDKDGNILNQAQYKSDGTYLAQDNRFNISTQSNDKIGLSTIELPNNIGGKTTYHFYNSGLFAVVQTDKNNNYHIAKPADNLGNNWTLSSTINGQRTETSTTDPIAQIGSTSPSPTEIIKDINYFRALPQTTNSVNFQDGFGVSSQVSPALIAQGNQVLKIASAQIPNPAQSSWIFGIKQTFAATIESGYTAPDTDDESSNKGNSKTRTGGDDQGNKNTGSAARASASSVAPASTTQSNVGIGSNTANVTVAANGSQNAQITNSSGAQIASSTTTGQSGNTTLTSGSNVINTIASVISANSTNFGTTPIGVPSTPSPTTCFLAGTLISTPNGPVAVETLKPGMKVYSYNEKTGAKEVSDFKGLDINFVDEYLIINEQIKTTTYHPFYVVMQTHPPHPNPLLKGEGISDTNEVNLPSPLRERVRVRGTNTIRNDDGDGMANGLLSQVKAGKLKVGDFLVDESGSPVLITSIQKVPKKQTVYNLLSVTPNDNFYADGILVHNYNNDMGDDKSNGDPGGSSWSDPGYSSSFGPSDI